MNSPLTTKRRNLALQKRRELLDAGTITGGYVQFPVRLMINIDNQTNDDGKKINKLHTHFSRHEIE